jgi:HPt (histidine-containing phosphotransfer) domain-containing protein
MHNPPPASSKRGRAAGPPREGATAGPDPVESRTTAALLPLVDPAVLEELEDELAGSGLAQRFARDYAALWDKRLARRAAAVDNRDGESALDAAISLKISSAMVGGIRLARLAELLEALIRQGDFSGGRVLMKQVVADGGRTVAQLQSTYITDAG